MCSCSLGGQSAVQSPSSGLSVVQAKDLAFNHTDTYFCAVSCGFHCLPFYVCLKYRFQVSLGAFLRAACVSLCFACSGNCYFQTYHANQLSPSSDRDYGRLQVLVHIAMPFHYHAL